MRRNGVKGRKGKFREEVEVKRGKEGIKGETKDDERKGLQREIGK